jgi:hypothetical protein
MTDDTGSLLSDEETLTVFRAAVDAAGEQGQSREDLQRVLDWAIEARLDAATLELVLTGQAGMYVGDSGKLIIKTAGPQ